MIQSLPSGSRQYVSNHPTTENFGRWRSETGLPVHIRGRVTETGLGSANVVSVADARREAHEARKLLDSGENPIAVKRRAELMSAGVPTFGSIADALIAAKESEWRNEKHRRNGAFR
jgi:hypothetical protein